MVGTFDSNDTLTKFHPIKTEHWVGNVEHFVRDGIIRDLSSYEYAEIAEADKLMGKPFSILRSSGENELGWTLSYVVGYVDDKNKPTRHLQIKCTSPVKEKAVEYTGLLRMNPSAAEAKAAAEAPAAA